MRCFIAINIPEKIKNKVFHISRNLHEQNLFHGKVTEKNNLHLTLKFLGEISQEQLEKVKKILNNLNLKKIKIKITNAGVFDENHIKIIWLKMLNLENFQKQIDEALKPLFKPEQRFMSHLTIARVKQKPKNPELLLEEIQKLKINKEFVLDTVKIMKSELFSSGPKYKVLETIPLVD